jgi:uncharacterized protein (TIGR02391 family)
MEENIKQYAQSLYDQAERFSLEELQKEKKEVFSFRKRSADQPIGGTEISAIMACHVHHIERSLEAKLITYQSAFAEGGVFPSEEDLRFVLEDIQQRQEQLINFAASAVNHFVLSRGGMNHDLTESIRNATGHGHDRVLRSWKVWRDKHSLKRQPNRTLKQPSLPSGAFYAFHPAVIVACREPYEAGQLKHAVLEAFIRVIGEVKHKSGLTSLDGDSLMNRAFGSEKQAPTIRFNALSTDAERDEQRGFMYMFKGIVGIRNNYAHTNTKLDDPERAHEYLTLASLLMRLLDSASN